LNKRKNERSVIKFEHIFKAEGPNFKIDNFKIDEEDAKMKELQLMLQHFEVLTEKHSDDKHFKNLRSVKNRTNNEHEDINVDQIDADLK
jgi:hypothetical protein